MNFIALKNVLFNSILSLSLITISIGASAQESSTSVKIFRPAESAMSGGKGLQVKFYVGDKEVGTILSGTTLTYNMSTMGEQKLKFVAEFGGSGVGSPYTETMTFEEGNQYFISITAGSMFGVKGSILDEKGMKKLAKQKFADDSIINEAIK